MKSLPNRRWLVCWRALFVFMGASLISGSYAAAGAPKLNDFDGDRKADLTLYNATNGLWSFRLSSMGYSVVQTTFGDVTYAPVPGDFDGDGKADLVLYCQTNGNWLVRLSGLGYATTLSATLGGSGDLPVAGDYDGDNKADLAVYSQSNGLWQIRSSGSGYAPTATSFGDFNYLPATGDFDGDAKSDLAIYNRTNELWLFALSSAGYTPLFTALGVAGSLPACGDFDGDGKTDLALYSQTNGEWSLRLSGAGYALINTTIGGVDWAPAAGDFDGDGKADLTVYNRTNGLWLFRLSTNDYAAMSTTFGGAGDRPLGSPAGSSWERYPGSPVVYPYFEITPGGAWSMATGDPSVLYDEQERTWKMWFSAAWAEGTNGRVGIKYAESADGKNWIIQDGLCLGPTGDTNDWDATDTDTPAVVKNPAAAAARRYLLWYSGGNTTQRLIGTSPYYQIGLAFSADGKTFARVASAESPYGQAGLVLMVQDAFPAYYPLVQDGVLAEPEVVLKDGVYHLWMSSVGMTATGVGVAAGISYATSSNGINWIPSPSNPLPTLQRQNPVVIAAHPSVLWNQSQGYFEMWYQSDSDSELEQLPMKEAGMVGYWRAISLNGEEWINYYNQARDFTGNRSYSFESYNLMAVAKVVLKDGEYYMYYPAYGTNNVPFYLTPPMWAINLAIRR